MATSMQQRRGSAADWTAANEVLPDGAIGVEEDTGKMKTGNGATGWNAREYINIPPHIFDAQGDLIVGTGDNAYAKLSAGAPHQRLTVQADGTLAWETPEADIPLSLFTAAGDIPVASAVGAVMRLAKGANGQMLGVSGGTVGWVTPSADVPLSTVTAAEDLIVGSGAGTVKRVGKGAANQTLAVVGGVLTWIDPPGVPKSTVTTAGDLIVGTGAGTVARLAKGAVSQELRMVAGNVAWADSPDVPLATVTTAGDLIVGAGSGVTRLGKGASGTFLGVVGGVLGYYSLFALVPCTSASRPSAPSVGQQIFETDTLKAYIWDGTAWRLIPTSSQSASFLQTPNGQNRLVQSGTFSFSMTSGSGGGSALGPITFPTAFGNTPNVVATGNYAVGLWVALVITTRAGGVSNFQYMADTKSGTFTGTAAGHSYIATDS